MEVFIQVTLSAIAMARVEINALTEQVTSQINGVMQSHPNSSLKKQLNELSKLFNENCPALQLAFTYQTPDHHQERETLTVGQASKTKSVLYGQVDSSHYGDYMLEKFGKCVH